MAPSLMIRRYYAATAITGCLRQLSLLLFRRWHIFGVECCSSARSIPLGGSKWATIAVLLRRTLHELDDHRK
jgi:hypothetical protein